MWNPEDGCSCYQCIKDKNFEKNSQHYFFVPNRLLCCYQCVTMLAQPAGRTVFGRAARTSRAEAPTGVFAGAGGCIEYHLNKHLGPELP